MNKALFLLLLCGGLVFGGEYKIYVEGMHCPLCTAMVRKALLKVEGVTNAKASLKDKIAKVACRDDISKEQLLEAVATTGCSGVVVYD